MLIEYNDKPLLDIACKKVQRSLRRRKVALLSLEAMVILENDPYLLTRRAKAKILSRE